MRRGLIHIVPKGNKIRVSLCAGRFSFSALAGTLHALHEEAPRRILLAVLSGEEWSYAICSNVAELAARAEDIANEKPFRRRPWLAIEISNQTFVNSPTSNRAAPLLRLWQETRGRMPENLLGHLREAGLLARSVVARPHGASSRLVIEYFGCGFTAMMKPCKSLLLVGRDLGDDYDQGYGGWVAETYARALSERRLRLAFIDATFQVSEGRTIRARYDRALIPWSRKSGELFVLGISINRSLSVVS
ncbi:MAG TPA: hypothetical protein VEI03_03655 [Stellaceae bacterium]|nr:hypothetical protein [Stellaceae bacterium]